MKYIMLLALLVGCSLDASIKDRARMFEGESAAPSKSAAPIKKVAAHSKSAAPVKKAAEVDEVQHESGPKGDDYKKIKEQSEKRIKKLESRIADIKRNLDPRANSDFRYFGAHEHSAGKAYLKTLAEELPKVQAVLKKFNNELAKAKMHGKAAFTVGELQAMRAKDRKKYDEEYAAYKKVIDMVKNEIEKNAQPGWK